MKALTCTKCGGQINPNTHKCEFCGTYYHEEVTYEIVGERSDFQTIAAHVEVPYYGALRGRDSGEILKNIAESDSHYAIDLLREKNCRIHYSFYGYRCRYARPKKWLHTYHGKG